MQNRKILFWLILFITLISVVIDLPKNLPVKFSVGKIKVDTTISGSNIDFSLGSMQIKRELEIKQGLDLSGGTHLVFQADMNGVAENDRQSAIEAVRNNIERRVNFFGISEPTVQTSKVNNEYRLIVELPGVKDVNQAIDLIGQTAQLMFYEQKEASPAAGFIPTDLTGKDLKSSIVKFDQNSGQPIVGLEFSADGAKKFADITTRNVKKIVAIYLDQAPISMPTVDEAITSGQAVIRGNFTLETAKQLSTLLNAGALPVPIKIIEQRNVGATLGQESVQKSVRAGMVGLLMVAGFMWAYYGKLGFLADLALIIYGLITLALYKLIPVTLTLPGIAGFILSIGMAVDSNILIFERMKEETRAGCHWKRAMELGFGRAWDSIRDANICTLITCFILFNPFNWNFLNVSGMIRGFALTLGLGIFISLFTGIVVTRTLLRVLYHGKEDLK
ncbi:protein translocase subunit SecD [Candidatus Shapirobacteria bacterium CG08_land_8_20_14_0_20_39_18]|uniref:Protein translocase subunit SecD n=1 Tax=Candidatus Shapirobacteria bacterium CG08_land_8_20_14_0_20_39_18 TaxID=1974883 RepID=A0A2M6XE35_9BACT|nr:MAG: protein translocase subunit SecD [Candidatus Shapirobacteria bacterium CG08_land_8_20_14_0_20_39_18]PIY64705.1 MAG: protein translocase subunit SecD [Candidatus Shapirobacteria bacterium CG_4_10_14_0_8_um_filter_39_15]PJE68772.1 MAG: protein translocase subunit SecD [Candidatus Shapirobacteria bacterium CG10_big_fil_rev_8_21_14_0_10_38_8]